MHPLGTVLCASDLGEASSEAIAQAAAVARADGARLVVVHVTPAPVIVPLGEVVVPVADPAAVERREEEALEGQLAALPSAAGAAQEVLRASRSIVDELLARAQALRA